jgi:hypothetical protein
MNSLIIKLGATGDVVRTTPLLRRLRGRKILQARCPVAAVVLNPIGGEATPVAYVWRELKSLKK